MSLADERRGCGLLTVPETDYETGLGIGMFIVFFYAVLGGMKGITYTQIAQYVVLITATPFPRSLLACN